MDPSQFYTGLVAELYAPLRSAAPDPEPYARFVGMSGEPALELGCGDGDPILELRSRGIDVEGLDSSADMLLRCRGAATALGIEVVLHEQPMESMDLGRVYQSIYLAGPTFNLLPDDETARAALARIAEHLNDGGSALIPLFIPQNAPESQIGRPRTHTTEDGIEMRFTMMSQRRDEAARTHVTDVRYERIVDGEAAQEDREWLLHWYTQDGFRELAADAGLTISAVLSAEATPAAPDDETFIFLLTRPHP